MHLKLRSSATVMGRFACGALAAFVMLAMTDRQASADPFDDLLSQISESSYTDHLNNKLFTHDGDSRGRYGAEHDLARDNIFNYFQSLGLDTSLHPFVYRSVTYYNVVGVHEGVTNPDQIYIVGSHYDSVDNPGADDNASGTAGVMEAARVMSKYRFDATIIFIAFDLEELGLLGSDAYAEDHKFDDIRGMISLDMIAYNPNGSDSGLIYGRDASSGIKNALANAMTTYTGLQPYIEGYMDASDHAPFEWRGFEACLLIEYDVFENPHYHTQQDSVDTPGYIDYAYATEMTRGTVACLATEAGLLGPVDYLLGDPWPGAVNRENTFKITGATPGARSFLVYGFKLGSTPVPGCSGVVVEIDRPTIFYRAVADARGEITFDKFVPKSARGVNLYLQAVEPSTCDTTVLLPFVFQ